MDKKFVYNNYLLKCIRGIYIYIYIYITQISGTKFDNSHL